MISDHVGTLNDISIMLLTGWPSETLCQTTEAWRVSHRRRPRCPECWPPTWPPASCGWYQDDQCKCWNCPPEQLSSFQWSLHSQQNLKNIRLVVVALIFPKKDNPDTQVSPDLTSLTRLKMVPGLPLMLKHRASPLSGSIMKWGSPSTSESPVTHTKASAWLINPKRPLCGLNTIQQH